MAVRPSFQIKIEGRERLAKAFNGLPVALQRKALRPALRVAAKIVQDEVRHTAQAMLGDSDPAPHVADTLKVRAMRRDRSQRGRIGMVVEAGKRAALGLDPQSKGYYPAQIEFGWLAGPRVQGPLLFDATKRTASGEFAPKGKTKKQADREMQAGRRHVPARPFMATGLRRAEKRAIAAMADEMSRQLKKMAGAPEISDAEFYADALGNQGTADVF